MKFLFAPFATTLLFAASTFAQTTLTINTPLNAVVCQPLLITWSGGTPPYFLSILPGNQPTAPALLDFGQQSGTQLTWLVNITAGTQLGLNLRDSTGALAQSAAFGVQPASDTSCLNPATSGGSSSSGAATPPGTTPPVTTPPATTPTTGPTTPAPNTTPTIPTTHTTPGTSAAAPASSKPATSSAASAQNLNIGFAGVLGAALVGLLA